MAKGTAKYIKTLDGFRGEANLYRLNPPYSDDEIEYVVVSAVDLPVVSDIIPGYRNSETMAFPSNIDGDIVDWLEIGFVDHKSHADCLADMQYDITE